MILCIEVVWDNLDLGCVIVGVWYEVVVLFDLVYLCYDVLMVFIVDIFNMDLVGVCSQLCIIDFLDVFQVWVLIIGDEFVVM